MVRVAAHELGDPVGEHTADENLTEALRLPGKRDDARKLAGTIRGHANKIEQQSDDVRAALGRLLAPAQAALSVAADAPEDAA